MGPSRVETGPGIVLAGKIFFVDYADNDGTFVYAILSLGRRFASLQGKAPPRIVSGPFMRDRRSALRKLLQKVADDEAVLDAILSPAPKDSAP